MLRCRDVREPRRQQPKESALIQVLHIAGPQATEQRPAVVAPECAPVARVGRLGDVAFGSVASWSGAGTPSRSCCRSTTDCAMTRSASRHRSLPRRAAALVPVLLYELYQHVGMEHQRVWFYNYMKHK
jgi:hypothetical protein